MRKFLKLLAFKLLLMSMTSLAYGWNCPAGQRQVQVAAGTPGTVVVEGLTFQCQPIPPTTPPPTTPPTTTSTSSSNSNSTSGATSTSGSTSSATGGNSNSNATGGAGGTSTSNASGGAGGKGGKGGAGGSVGAVSSTGGNATGGTVASSGNSKQGQQQSATSSATGNGSNSNDTTNNTNVAATKIPVATAYAPTSLPTVPCFKGFSGGVQTMQAGVTFGGGKVDDGCDIRETARSYALIGSRLAACKMMVSSKKSKQAGVTLEDCMASEPVAEVVQTPVVTPAPVPVVVTLVVPPAPIVAPVPQPSLLASCAFYGTRVDNVCKAMLDTAVLYYKENSDGYLIVAANPLTGYIRATNVRDYLVSAGVEASRVREQPSRGKNVDVLYSTN